ncbi:Retrovirus-related Pol polyprotein [Arachis hypogaea]|nr:Retrovirus-related Pol polyprotein [Arachis hypogaea]
MTWLLASINTSFEHNVVKCKFFYEMWEKIEDFFAASSSAREQSLKSQLRSIRFTSTAKDYLARIRQLVDSLHAIESLFSDSIQEEAEVVEICEEADSTIKICLVYLNSQLIILYILSFGLTIAMFVIRPPRLSYFRA